MPDLAEILREPDWLPLGIDRARGVIEFGRISRQDAARAAFLDHRAAAAVAERAAFPIAEAMRAGAPPAPVPAFIFHTSFCCSTLLARALDKEGRVLALKEPNILLDLANALRVDEALKRDAATAGRLVATVFALLARPPRGESRVVLKPTNSANSLIDAAIGAGAPTLLLYGPLQDYLVSILKKGEEGRAFVRQQFNIFALDGAGLGAIPQRQALGFTDLQIAALVWRCQIETFARALAIAPRARLAALDYRDLLRDPARALPAVARHLALDIPESDLEKTATSEIFARDSKFDDRSFDAAARDAEERAVLDQWRAPIDLILAWADKLDLGVTAPMPLPRALLIP